MRAFGVVQMAGAHERLERYFAVVASIFVDRHYESRSFVFDWLRVLDQHAARRLGMEKADHPGQSRARLLIDQRNAFRARGLQLGSTPSLSKHT